MWGILSPRTHNTHVPPVQLPSLLYILKIECFEPTFALWDRNSYRTSCINKCYIRMPCRVINSNIYMTFTYRQTQICNTKTGMHIEKGLVANTTLCGFWSRITVILWQVHKYTDLSEDQKETVRREIVLQEIQRQCVCKRQWEERS